MSNVRESSAQQLALLWIPVASQRSLPGISARASGGFFVRVMRFVSQHPGFGAATPLAILAAAQFDTG